MVLSRVYLRLELELICDFFFIKVVIFNHLFIQIIIINRVFIKIILFYKYIFLTYAYLTKKKKKLWQRATTFEKKYPR
jgi:hypothetical protein